MNKVYKILINILFLTLAASVSFSQQYWLTLNSPTTKNLRSCSFTDSLNGWAAGDTGTIIRTSNGGNNWVIQSTNITENIHFIYFLNSRLGWALAWDLFTPNFTGTIILSTTNGGSNWTKKMYPEPDIYWFTLLFQDSLNGWMGGYPIPIVKTTNYGQNWNQVSIDSSIVMNFAVRCFVFSQNIGIAGGGFYDFAGVAWTTTNYGLNWKAETVGPEPLNEIVSFDHYNYLSVGGDLEWGSGVLTTTNAGVNWKYQSLGFFGIAYAVSFRTRTEGWAPLGFVPQFLYTLDGGENWDTLGTPDYIGIYDVQFTDSMHGYAVGDQGRLLKFNSTIIGVNEDIKNVIPQSSILKQNYPNPFNPITNINFSLENTSYIELKIFDITGKLIKTLYSGIVHSGEHSCRFFSNGLPSGVYLYKIYARELNSINAEERIETRKMIILK